MPLELRDLNDDERLALAALIELVVSADNTVTEPEEQRLRAIIAAVGENAYQAAAETADERFEDEEALRRFLPTIGRQEARELIYETVLEEALADVRIGPETELLDWLAKTWKIETRIVDSPQEE
jgi:uncharacterized tellurite resistance protein B-like protein